MKNKNENYYDVIIIGSGLSGLAAGALLTKINKKKVLILERHYEIGGLTHEFKRGPYSWDIGLHYVGNISLRFFDNFGKLLFDYLTNDKLKWNKMPKVFDKLIFPDLKIDIEESVNGYKNALLKKFPEEKKVINKYLKDIHKIRKWYLYYFFTRFFKFPIKQIFHILVLLNKKKALMTTKEYLNRYVKNDKLKAILSARWANYGVAPAKSAFATHALVEHHYYSGAIFPDGGAEKIAALIEETIETGGGKILVNREVKEILLKGKKAIGVKVKNLSIPESPLVEYYSDCIISAVGADTTFLSLLPESLNLKIQQKLKKFQHGYSGIDVYLGLKESPEKLGIKGENYWIFDNYDIDSFFKEHFKSPLFKPIFCFLSFPSLKSGKKQAHTADIVTILPENIFEMWQGEKWKRKKNSYYIFKEQVSEKLIDFVNKYIPGFKDLIAYKEVATPLTFEHFTNRKGGLFYGLPAFPERFVINELKVKTEIKGLYLTGVDILSNGIFPALFSAVGTVSYLNGVNGITKIILKVLLDRLVRKKIIKKESNFETEDKAIGILIKKKERKKHIIELTFSFKRELIFLPGQHVKLLVGEGEWRAYSVAKINNNELTLLIDTRPDGLGSNYAKNIQIGEKALFRMPIPEFSYQDNNKKIMFIATGTGLVPFLHILDELKKQNIKKEVVVLFGCLNESENIADEYLNEYRDFFNIQVYICVENLIENKENYFKGRVTDLLKQKMFDLTMFDFYICGHPHMTQDVLKFLRENGVERIFY